MDQVEWVEWLQAPGWRFTWDECGSAMGYGPGGRWFVRGHRSDNSFDTLLHFVASDFRGPWA